MIPFDLRGKFYKHHCIGVSGIHRAGSMSSGALRAYIGVIFLRFRGVYHFMVGVLLFLHGAGFLAWRKGSLSMIEQLTKSCSILAVLHELGTKACYLAMSRYILALQYILGFGISYFCTVSLVA